MTSVMCTLLIQNASFSMKKEAIKHPRHTNKSETPPYKNSNFTKLEVEKHGQCFVDDIF